MTTPVHASWDDDPVLPKVLARRADLSPDAPFVADAGSAPVSYGEFWHRVLRCARELDEAGIEAGERVGVLLETSTDALVVWIALTTLGATEVPFNLASTANQLADLCADAGVRTVVGRQSFVSVLREAQAGWRAPVTRVVTIGDESESLADALHLGPAGTSSGALGRPDRIETLGASTSACVLYTSGTTGRSKGVAVPWGQLQATAHGLLAEVPTADDVAYVPAPLFHVGGKAPVFLMAAVGGQVVVRPSFKTDRFWSEVMKHGCTVTFLGAAMASFLLESTDAPPRGEHSLRDVLMVPTIPRLSEFVERFGVRVCTAYNMTELSCPIVSGWISAFDGTCGQVRNGYECRVVDRNDIDVEAGKPGELVVRALAPWTLSSGYVDNDAATVEAWKNLWFHTGDVMREYGGRFAYVDRLKDTVRRRGENISSVQLEHLLAEHPAVVEAAVVGVPSEFGEEEVLAFVRLTPVSRVGAAELSDGWSEFVPRFMQPRYIEIVSDLPRTANEKVRKGELRARGVGPDTWQAPHRR